MIYTSGVIVNAKVVDTMANERSALRNPVYGLRWTRRFQSRQKEERKMVVRLYSLFVFWLLGLVDLPIYED